MHTSSISSLWFALGLVLALVLAAGPAGAGPPPVPATGETTFSPDVTIEINSGAILLPDEDTLIEFEGGGKLPNPLGTLPVEADLRGYHFDPSTGHQLFVLDTSAVLPGAGLVEPRDVVLLLGGVYSLLFDGSAEGVPDGARIDVVTAAEDTDLILSFDTTVTIGGVTAADEDLVRFDPVGGPSLFFDGSAAGVPDALDLDGAHYIRASQNLQVSFDTAGSLGGLTFQDEDVLEYDADSGSWALAIDAASAELGWEAADATAYHLIRSCASLGGDSDNDLLCDFEDPCPSFANTLPIVDTNGDRIPNECQCGDADGNGFIQFADALELSNCASGGCAVDLTIGETDNNGFFQFADAFGAANVASNTNPAYTLTCARRPSGTIPPALP